jgi:hypothetical protein
MREELAKRLGLRGEFRATFHRRGISRNYWGVRQTALFIDVRDEAGVQVTDHLWFFWGKQMGALNLQPGDRVRFVATVTTYTKRDRASDYEFGWEEDELRRFVTDYKLIYPSNMRLLGASQGTLPLFEASEAI